jgi:hypothetical protein
LYRLGIISEGNINIKHCHLFLLKKNLNEACRGSVEGRCPNEKGFVGVLGSDLQYALYFICRSEVEGHEKNTEPSFHIQQDENVIHPDVRDQ